MLARVSDPGTIKRFSTLLRTRRGPSTPVWRRCVAIPDRRGVLILDDTRFPKQGTASVGVRGSTAGTLGKIAQLSDRGHRRAVDGCPQRGCSARKLYLPQPWLTPAARSRPASRRVRFQEKWRLALDALSSARAAGIGIIGRARPMRNLAKFRRFARAAARRCPVRARDFRRVHGLRRAPTLAAARRAGVRAAPARADAPGRVPSPVATSAAPQPARAWRLVTWRNGPRPGVARPLRSRSASRRLMRGGSTPAPDVWLLCERPAAGTPRTK